MPVPDTPAAIRAAFAEWRMVKSRKVLQLVFEVPLETQGEVLTMLGAPMPDAEIWCAIARLASLPPAERPGVEPSSPTARARASEMGKERYAALPPMEQARVRSCVLPTNGRFQQWVASETGGVATEEFAELYIKARCCNHGSRYMIADTRACYDLFLTMETDFKVWDGQLPERRG